MHIAIDFNLLLDPTNEESYHSISRLLLTLSDRVGIDAVFIVSSEEQITALDDQTSNPHQKLTQLRRNFGTALPFTLMTKLGMLARDPDSTDMLILSQDDKFKDEILKTKPQNTTLFLALTYPKPLDEVTKLFAQASYLQQIARQGEFFKKRVTANTLALNQTTLTTLINEVEKSINTALEDNIPQANTQILQHIHEYFMTSPTTTRALPESTSNNAFDVLLKSLYETHIKITRNPNYHNFRLLLSEYEFVHQLSQSLVQFAELDWRNKRTYEKSLEDLNQIAESIPAATSRDEGITEHHNTLSQLNNTRKRLLEIVTKVFSNSNFTENYLPNLSELKQRDQIATRYHGLLEQAKATAQEWWPEGFADPGYQAIVNTIKADMKLFRETQLTDWFTIVNALNKITRVFNEIKKATSPLERSEILRDYQSTLQTYAKQLTTLIRLKSNYFQSILDRSKQLCIRKITRLAEKTRDGEVLLRLDPHTDMNRHLPHLVDLLVGSMPPLNIYLEKIMRQPRLFQIVQADGKSSANQPTQHRTYSVLDVEDKKTLNAVHAILQDELAQYAQQFDTIGQQIIRHNKELTEHYRSDALQPEKIDAIPFSLFTALSELNSLRNTLIEKAKAADNKLSQLLDQFSDEFDAHAITQFNSDEFPSGTIELIKRGIAFLNIALNGQSSFIEKRTAKVQPRCQR